MAKELLPWDEIAKKQEFQSLPKDERERLRERYFSRAIAPKVPTEKLAEARKRFDDETNPGLGNRAIDAGKDLARAVTPAAAKTVGAIKSTFSDAPEAAAPPALAGLAPPAPTQAPAAMPVAGPPQPQPQSGGFTDWVMGAGRDAADMARSTLGGMVPKMPAAGEEAFRGAVRGAMPAAAGLAAAAGGSGQVQSDIQQSLQVPDAVDQAMLGAPRSETFQDWSKRGDEIREEIEASFSPKLKEALKGSQIKGNIFKGELDLGDDPTLYGYGMQVAGVLASMGPMLATTLLTRSPAAGASVGGLMAGSEGMDAARTWIGERSDEELAAQSPAFRGLLKRGIPPEQARQIITDKAAETAATLQGMVAAVGDVFTGKLITGAFDDVLTQVGGSVAGRVAAGAAAGAAEGGVTELAEGVAADAAIAGQVPTKEIGEDSAANLILGAMGGGTVGAAAGAMSASPEQQIGQQMQADAAGIGSDPAAADLAARQAMDPNLAAGGVVPPGMAARPQIVPERGPISRSINTGAAAELQGLPTIPMEPEPEKKQGERANPFKERSEQLRQMLGDDDGTGLATPARTGLGPPKPQPGQGPAVRPRIPATPNPKSGIAPGISQSLSQHASRAANRFSPGMDEAAFSDLAHRVMWQESRGKHSARSPAGAQGLMQVMPGTAKDPGFGIKPLANDSAEENMRFGTEYLAAMLKRYNGDVNLALIAYNAGPGTADDYKAGKRTSLPKETQDYIAKITGGSAVPVSGAPSDVAAGADPLAPPRDDVSSEDVAADLVEDVELDLFGDPIRRPDAVDQNEAADVETTEVPLAQIKMSPDVPQFKLGANADGVVEPLGGKFDRRGVAPVQLWERLDGELQLISGRHRRWLALESGEQTIPAQIHREADGFTVEQARVLDAELNIRDGQGKAIDYVDYFKAQGLTEQQAREAGLVARNPGKRGFTLAASAGETLLAHVRAGRLQDTDAEKVALAAPGNEALQAVAIDQAVNQGQPINRAIATMQAVQAMAKERGMDPGGETGDLFGFDDSQMREAERMGKAAAAKQAEIARDIAAVNGAAKNPETARKYGVDVKDPASVKKRIAELRAERDAWANWPTNPELVAQVRGEPKAPAAVQNKPAAAPVKTPKAKPAPTPTAASTGVVVRSDGKPFAEEAQAVKAAKARRMAATHEPVQVGGGWGLKAKAGQGAAARVRPMVVPGQVVAKESKAPFDPVAWQAERDVRIKDARARNARMLDKADPYVETLRGRQISYLHGDEKGVITTVDNNGFIYVKWQTGAQAGEPGVLSPSDGKDYEIVGEGWTVKWKRDGSTDADVSPPKKKAAAPKPKPSAPPAPQGDEGGATPEAKPEPPTLDLAPQSPAEIKAQEAERQRKADEARDEEKKAKADEARDDFVLSGSNRPVDMAEARGQGNLFDQPTQPEQADAPNAEIDSILPDPNDADAAFWAALDEAFPQEAPKAKKPRAPSKPRTAKASAASAAKNTSAAFEEAGKALVELFNPGKGTLGSGPVFNEETYAKAKPHFVEMTQHLKGAGADVKDLVKAIVFALRDQFGLNRQGVVEMHPYVTRFAEDVQRGVIQLEEPVDVSTPDQNEAGSVKARQDPVDEGSARDGTGGAATESGPTGPATESAGTQPGRRGSVSGGRPAAAGSGRGSRVSGAGGKLGRDESAPRGDDGLRSDEDRAGGLADGREGGASAQASAARALAAAERVKVKPADPENIAATLPQLLPAQREDVLIAERRYFEADGRGMLFTNGTGTGKTFVGLGIVKRFAMQGKSNVIITVPGENVANAWVREGKKHFGLDIVALKDTSDAGQDGQIVVTTYANFGQNPNILRRSWDLVVHDEAHYLMQSQAGEVTAVLAASRAITGHPGGRYAYANAMHPEIVKELAELPAMMKVASGEGLAALMNRQAFLSRELERLRKPHIENREKHWEAKGTRRLDLSATPFAYESSIDMAEGFLFDYGPERTSGAYNAPSAHGAFFIENFGYRMRYGKLTKPDAKVDSGLMQRQFNAKLKKAGALSGRRLSVEQDYSREFVAFDSTIGYSIDDGFEYIRNRSWDEKDPLRDGYRELMDELQERFDYHERIKLLEAIKAPVAIERAKQHLALGRKVVIFHSRIKGGSRHPFHFSEEKPSTKAAIADFKAQRPDLWELDLGMLSRPLDLFAAEFGERAVFYNGTVSKKDKVGNPDRFNQDDSGVDVIVVQDDAGKEGISLHDTSGKRQRVLMNIGLPIKPTQAIQIEGRIFRVGQASNAIFEYFTTGTSFERYTFASKISERASTAENLAMGDEARRLRDAFVDAFESPVDAAPHAEQGVGGKEFDQSLATEMTPFEEAKTHYFANQKRTGRRDQREGVDYYATPEPIGFKMVEWAGIRNSESALEPSAGHGAIARYFPENTRNVFVEPSTELVSRLALRGNGTLRQERFENLDVGANKFDAIAMNPPYGSGGKTAVEHLAKAMDHLKNGGRIVALMPTGPAADKRIDALLLGTDAEFLPEMKQKLKDLTGEKASELRRRIARLENFHLRARITLPRVTFERAGTQVATQILVIDRVDGDAGAKLGPASNIDLSNAETIAELFDRIEDLSVKDRVEQQMEPDEVLANNGLTVTELPDGGVVDFGADRSGKSWWAYELSGKTYDHRDKIGPIMRKHGGGWNTREKAWVAQTDPREDLAKALLGQPVEGLEAAPAPVAIPDGVDLIEHTTAKGKTLRGVVRADMTQEQAKAIDPYTFKKNGGWFIRAEHLGKLDDAPRFMFAGENAATADTHALSSAQARLAAGEDAETVRQETGWHTGADGKWRFEISDDQAELKIPFKNIALTDLKEGVFYPYALGDVLRHERLFAAYPGLDNLPFFRTAGNTENDNVRGATYTQPDGTVVRIAVTTQAEDPLSVLLHEIQHAIQYHEGFAVGASDTTEKGAYRRSAGEMESRNVQTRQHWTPDQRKVIAPRDTQDVRDADIIVTFNGEDVMSASAPANAVLSGFPATRIRAAVAPIVDAWARKVDVQVLPSVNDPKTPDAVRKAHAKLGAADTVDGVYYKGAVYLFADAITSEAHAVEVLMHEALGHLGLRGAFGGKLVGILDEIATARRADVLKKTREYGLDPTNRNDMRQAAEEVLAEMAQTRPELGFVRRAIAAIRQWLREHVPALRGMKLTDAEIIRQFILPARAFVEGGGRGMIEQDVRFALTVKQGRIRRTIDELAAAAQSMATWRGWYDKHDATLKDLFVEDADLFQQILSATSQAVTVKANVGLALKAYRQFLSGMPFEGYLPAVIKNLEKIRDNEKVRGAKISQYDEANAGNADAIAVDRHIAMLFFNTKTPSRAQIESAKRRIRAIATKLEWEPRQVQAALWAFNQVRLGTDPAQVQSYDKILEGKRDRILAIRAEFGGGGGRGVRAGRDAVSGDQGRHGGEPGRGGVDPDIRFARRARTQLDPVLAEARRKSGRPLAKPFKERITESVTNVFEAIKTQREAATDSARQGMLDQFHGIKRAEQRNLGNLPTEQSAYVTARLANGIGSVMRAVLMHGAPKWSANRQHLEKIPDTKGLLQILEPVANDMDAWLDWMIGNRANRLMSEGKENLFTQDEIDMMIASGKGKETLFREVSRDFARFKRSILDVAEQAGLIDPEARLAWDHADWIPFYRNLEESGRTLAPKSSRELAGQSSGIRMLRGGTAVLNDPVENIIMNFHHLLDASLKNNAVRKAVRAAGPGVVKKVGLEFKKSTVPRSEIRRELGAQGVPDAVVKAFPPEVFDGIARMWSMQPPSDKDVIRVMEGGKAAYYRVLDPLLLRAVTSYEPYQWANVPGMRAARAAKRLLTRAVTSTPEFMLRNFIRDTGSTAIISRSPVAAAGAIKGILQAYNESGAAEHMLFAGASFASGYVQGGDPSSLASGLREALRRKGMNASSVDGFMASLIDTPLKFWDQYRLIGEAIENANREAVFESVTKRGGSTTEAAFESKDLMDFALRGGWAGYQLLADVIPFFNARVQGLYRLGRTDPKQLAVRGAVLLTLPTILLALSNLGNDDYEELPDWDKDTYWHFFVGGKHFRIPKPFEVGLIFGTIPERMTMSLLGPDTTKKAAERAAWGIAETMNLGMMPQLVDPLLQVAMNRDTFRGIGIENMGDEAKLPHLRASGTTSETLRELLRMTAPVTDPLGISPKRLQFLIEGYLGTMGAWGLDIVDAGTRMVTSAPSRPAMRPQDMPMLRVLYRGEEGDPVRSTQFISDVYDAARAYAKVKRSVDALMKDGNHEAARVLMERHEKRLTLGAPMDKAADRLTKLSKEMDAIYKDKVMDPEIKRARLEELMRQRAEVARGAVETRRAREGAMR